MKIISTKYLFSIPLAIYFVGASITLAQNQTLEDLRREKAEQKERNQLLQDIIDLRAKNAKLEVQLAADKASPGGTTAASDIGGSKGTAGNAGGTGNSGGASGSAPIPIGNLSEVKESVCLRQDLNPDTTSRFEFQVCDLARQLGKDYRNRSKIVLEPGATEESVITFILAKLAGVESQDNSTSKLREDVRAFILEAENKRNDKQVGSDGKSAGSTSLAVKGGVPQFIGWALENGGITGSQNGTTLAFRVNPVGLLESFNHQYPLSDTGSEKLFDQPDSFTDALRKISFGFSFDISRGTDPPVFIGSKQQLSAFSVRYNFINHRDPLNSIYKEAWETFRIHNLDPYAKTARDIIRTLACPTAGAVCTSYVNADLEKWRVETEAALRAVDLTSGQSDIVYDEQIRAVLASRIDLLPIERLKQDATLITAMTRGGEALLDYNKKKDELLKKIAKGTIVTAEYTNFREVNSPDYSNFRFIAQKGFGSDWSLNANASISFFDKRPLEPSVKRIRDFDFTLELEKPLKELRFGRPVFSFAGQYQRLPGDMIGPNGLLVSNTKGDTAVGQLKLTIPINGTGIKLPFSITFANRSDLIKESTVRGNFGFTFDLDRLLLGHKLF